MILSQDEEKDVALEALSSLSEITTSSIDGLAEVNEQLVSAQKQVSAGLPWKRAIMTTDLASALSALSRIAADLGRASGDFRRALSQVLRKEGLKLAEIGGFLEVTRQRVSALLRSRAE